MQEAIRLISVSKEYPGVKALSDVTFSVKKGSIHGFLGPNGAGKTTAMKIMAGLIPATHGQVEILGIEPQKASGRVGFLPETPPLYHNMKVRDYLLFVASINGVGKSELEKALQETLKKCSLESVADRLIANLSKGYKQRVGIAQALIHSPELVILDEPTVGLDPVAIQDIRDIILSLGKERTIFFSSHQLHEVGLLCEEITVINKGEIIHSGTISEIQNKLQSQQVLKVELSHWHPDLKNELLRLLPIETISAEAGKEGTVLRIVAKGKEDLRQALSLTLIQKGCQLYSLTEEKMELEEIFNHLTKTEAK